MLIKPSYDKPVETSEDVIARNLTIIDSPGRESMVEAEKKSPISIVRELAMARYISKVSCLIIQLDLQSRQGRKLQICYFLVFSVVTL